MKIVIAEPLRAAGIDILKAQPDWEIVTSSPAEYTQHLADAEVLIASRFAKVTAAQIAAAKKLRVIAFAGVGTDFVDLEAATTAGVLVMNMPGESAVAARRAGQARKAGARRVFDRRRTFGSVPPCLRGD